MRWLLGVLAVALLGWVVVLIAVSPATREFEADDTSWTVSCAGVLEAGWPFAGDPEWAASEAGGPLTDGYDDGELPGEVTQQYIADRCQDLRTTRVGLAAVLAVPTTLCGVGAALPRRRADVAPR